MDKKHTVDKQVFGQRLKYLMTNFNETTYSMSRKFNLSPPSISRYTRGEMAPKSPPSGRWQRTLTSALCG